MQKLIKKEATKEWINTFKEVDTSTLESKYGDSLIDVIVEHTPVIEGEYVYYQGTQLEVSNVEYNKNYEGVINRRTSNVELILNNPEIKTIPADEIEYIHYNGEAMDVEGITDDFEFIIVNNEDLKIPFKDVEAIDYEGVDKAKVIDVYEDEFEVEFNSVVVSYDKVETCFESLLPMWNTLWEITNSSDVSWVMKNLEVVAKCGFRIYEDTNNRSILLGIDSGGYDFYKAHWIPLYEARGLMWHQ